jgi:hypothetical protein
LQHQLNVEACVFGVTHAEGDVLEVAEQCEIAIVVHDWRSRLVIHVEPQDSSTAGLAILTQGRGPPSPASHVTAFPA